MDRNSAPRPSITTSASAVATSWRLRRPSQPIPSAPTSANAPRPIRVLMPMRLAPAAPANAPCGTASATNDEPRSTMKNPTTPATTATMVATVQVFTMKPENIAALPAGPGWPCPRAAGPADSRQLGEQVEDEDQGHHEEADWPAVLSRRPVETVV